MTEMVVIEKNNTRILSGFMDALLVSCAQTSLIGASEHAKRTTAPSKAIIQYVSNLNLPILICGNKRIDKITETNVIDEITIVAIITEKIICLHKEKTTNYSFCCLIIMKIVRKYYEF